MKLKERRGFELFRMRLLYYVLYPFFHCKVILPDYIRKGEEPVVFVANHYSIFGPFGFVISVSLRYRWWSNEELLSAEAAQEALVPGIKELLPFIKNTTAEKLGRKIAFFVSGTLKKTCPISVDRKNPAKLISTLRQSVSSLEIGEHLLIFPENGIPAFSLTSVTPFHPGFATIGKVYQRKTGKPLRFCPCYIDQQHRTIIFGDPVLYQADGPQFSEESLRVSDELNLSIRRMAQASHEPRKKESPSVRRLTIGGRMLLFCFLLALLAAGHFDCSPAVTGIYAAALLVRYMLRRFAGDGYTVPTPGNMFLSRAVRTGMDLTMLLYLSGSHHSVIPLIPVFGLNELIFLLSNVSVFLFKKRYAGDTYYDTQLSLLISSACLIEALSLKISRYILPCLTVLAFPLFLLAAWSNIVFNRRLSSDEI